MTITFTIIKCCIPATKYYEMKKENTFQLNFCSDFWSGQDVVEQTDSDAYEPTMQVA